jgi:ribosomal protein S18 acetylase RimI-like enzyme
MTEDGVVFRSINIDDFKVIKSLHEDFFPIRYSDSYYIDVCKGRSRSGELFTRVAVSQVNNEIVGFVIAQIQQLDLCEDKDLFRIASTARKICYILTLGMKETHRRFGLGTKLINLCTEYSKFFLDCGAVSILNLEFLSLSNVPYKQTSLKF